MFDSWNGGKDATSPAPHAELSQNRKSFNVVLPVQVVRWCGEELIRGRVSGSLVLSVDIVHFF